MLFKKPAEKPGDETILEQSEAGVEDVKMNEAEGESSGDEVE